MKRILVLGAGRSSPFLIRRLLAESTERGWTVVVGDLDPDLAASRVDGHPRGEAIALDAGEGRLAAVVEGADVVVNLLPPALLPAVARQCVRSGSSMVSVSYATPELRALDGEARARGVLLVAEVGLDPGIDLMGSMSLIDRVHAEGGIVESYESYGSGVPAPDSLANPLKYAVTWDPRNVVRAGASGAHYLSGGKLKAVPRHRVFSETWPVEVPGIGTLEAYPNRDSLVYRRILGLAQAETLIRGTLRYPGFCATWRQIGRLGLASEEIAIPNLADRSFAELVEMFLPDGLEGATVEERARRFLGLSPGDPALDNLRWLGLFSNEPSGAPGATATDALAALLERKLRLPPGGRDMVVLFHRLVARYPRSAGPPALRRRVATLIEHGEPDGVTAMARTVGLPAAITARLALTGGLALTGCHIPTEPAIYEPVLASLAEEGVRFEEAEEALAA